MFWASVQDPLQPKKKTQTSVSINFEGEKFSILAFSLKLLTFYQISKNWFSLKKNDFSKKYFMRMTLKADILNILKGELLSIYLIDLMNILRSIFGKSYLTSRDYL
jgi:hypothetical protein